MSFQSSVLLLVAASLHFPEVTTALNPDNPFLPPEVLQKCPGGNVFISLWSCEDRKSCVPSISLCDGKEDCADGSDETKLACQHVRDSICPEVSNNSSQFQCKYGATVAQVRVCDGHHDCSDGSDEVECKRCYCKPSTSKSYPYFQCKYGACIDKEKRCDGIKDCPDSSDEEDCPSTSLKPNKKACRLPQHPANGRNSILCSIKEEEEAVCRGKPGRVVSHGTILVTTCNTKYLLAHGDGYSVCDNGVWRPPPQTCVECGVSGKTFDPDEELTLIHLGENSELGDFPWMAAVYLKNASGEWVQSCGATLISSHVVLTAAHCVFSTHGKIHHEDIQVGLGKLSRDYYHHETSATIVKVREIVTPQQYVGVTRHYDMDIALLDLADPVPFSSNIRPACIDLRGRFKPSGGDICYLAGWGKTDDGEPSAYLQWARQEYIEYNSCLTRVRNKENIKYLTHDKFCVAKVRGSQADKGDSGGGLTFIKDRVHFVAGIVSSKLPEEEEPMFLFTSIANREHRTWLKDHWRRLTKYH